MITLGQKIKNFRKRSGMSQMELEIAISSSPGSISRIESDKVNPTKETLKAIAEALGLGDEETVNLFEIEKHKPSLTSVEQAIIEASPVLNRSDVFAYLLDDLGYFHMPSKGFIDALRLTKDDLSVLQGVHFFEMIFIPEFGIKGIVDQDYFDEIMTLEIARFHEEYDLQKMEVFTHLFKIPHFKKLWNQKSSVSHEDLLSTRNKLAYLIVNGQKTKFTFSREKLKKNPRFELVEYFNAEEY